MVGEVLEGGREGIFSATFIYLGGEILFWCFYSFGRGRSSAFVFFHWVEESFSLLHTFGREESSFTWERGYPLFFFLRNYRKIREWFSRMGWCIM